MKILGIIPARGGSKGIPKKNIVDLMGHPLIEYTIIVGNKAKKSGILDEVIVSTDDREIAEIAKRCGAFVPFIRPAELATDKSKSIDFVIHALEYYKNQGKEFDAVMILQPTSPLRTYEDIKMAIEIYTSERKDSLISCSEDCNFNSLGAYFLENGAVIPLDKRHNWGMRRQDYPKLYVRNGAIFITNVDYLERNGLIISDTPSIYVMPHNRAINIDTLDDLEMCRKIMTEVEYENR